MSTAVDTQLVAALRRAAIRATYAPSVHNTQPWHFDLHSGGLSLLADTSRQLLVGDPARRQLTMSVGCALFNARVALAAAQVTADVARTPDPIRSTLLARITATGRSTLDSDPIADYDSLLEERQTDRDVVDEPVPAAVVDALVAVASAEDAILLPLADGPQRNTVAALSRRAREIQLLDAAYRAELRAWSTAAPADPSDGHCLLLLGTQADDVASWLRAGEALERVLLEITRRGFAASPLCQVVEVGTVRADLRHELGIAWFPHVLLRVGRAPAKPAARRRRLVDVLTEAL